MVTSLSNLPDVVLEEIVGHAVLQVLVPTAMFQPSYAVEVRQALLLRLVSKDFRFCIQKSLARAIHWTFDEPRYIPDLPITRQNRRRLSYRPFLDFCNITGICHYTKAITLSLSGPPFRGALALLDKCRSLRSLSIETGNSRKSTEVLEAGVIALSQLRYLHIGDTAALEFLGGALRDLLTLHHLHINGTELYEPIGPVLPVKRVDSVNISGTSVRYIVAILEQLSLSPRRISLSIDHHRGEPIELALTAFRRLVVLLQGTELMEDLVELVFKDRSEHRWNLRDETMALESAYKAAGIRLDGS